MRMRTISSTPKVVSERESTETLVKPRLPDVKVGRSAVPFIQGGELGDLVVLNLFGVGRSFRAPSARGLGVLVRRNPAPPAGGIGKPIPPPIFIAPVSSNHSTMQNCGRGIVKCWLKRYQGLFYYGGLSWWLAVET
jgi:hypothetical protein